MASITAQKNASESAVEARSDQLIPICYAATTGVEMSVAKGWFLVETGACSFCSTDRGDGRWLAGHTTTNKRICNECSLVIVMWVHLLKEGQNLVIEEVPRIEAETEPVTSIAFLVRRSASTNVRLQSLRQRAVEQQRDL